MSPDMGRATGSGASAKLLASSNADARAEDEIEALRRGSSARRLERQIDTRWRPTFAPSLHGHFAQSSSGLRRRFGTT